MIRLLALGTLLLGLFGPLAGAAFAADPLKVYTVNYPLAYFAERIAGEYAEVGFPAPAGIDPVFWQPSVEEIGAYQRADLILLNGAEYAKWIDKVSLPRSRQVSTSKAFADRYVAIEDVQTHSHGSDGEHSHTGTAWTTWLDLEQAALQAKAIAEALSRKRPGLADTFEQNFRALEQDLMALDQELTELVQTRAETLLLASHPVYQYLARRYGLNLKSVQWEPQEIPDAEQWSQLNIVLGEHPAGWMIWEGEPAAESVERLEALDVKSLVFDPSANRPEQGDFLSVMHDNVANLRAAYTTGTQ